MSVSEIASAREPAGWRVSRWAKETALSESYVWLLIASGEIRSVKVGKARVILTSPQEFLEALAQVQGADE